ncbi:MAG: hydantoinase/oxoprolinase family protein [Salinirussus sp.]
MVSVGIDIGGTFTDAVLVSAAGVEVTKTPTTDDLVEGVVTGFERVCTAAGVAPEAVDRFAHSSTVSVNALIEDEGATTALVTTAGFRDILEIGETHKDANLLYNFCGPVEPPLIPRRHRFEVTERIDADGEVRTAVQLADVDRIVEELRGEGIESVAVCLLHAYRNPSHEQAVAARIDELTEDIVVSRSSVVSPVIREYPRTCTTAVDAYLRPRIQAYLSRLHGELDEAGLTVPVNIMKSDGGLARADIAAHRPVVQMLSGPVGGVTAAQHTGERIDRPNLVTLDMGGTSADVAVIENGALSEVTEYEVRGLKINGPFVDVSTVGAGGGSIARIDDVGALRVGPQSAGAEPGPACYGKGGDRPTVTDADLVLGLLNPDGFGEAFSLDEAAARAALREHVAHPADLDLHSAARAIREVTVENLASSLRVATVQEGHDPQDFALICFGGAGPLYACDVAAEMGVKTVIFPAEAGVFSAVGLLTTPLSHEYVQSVVTSVDAVNPTTLTERIDDMVAEGNDDLATEDIPVAERNFHVSFDMQYASQAHHLNVSHEGQTVTPETLDTLVTEFERTHEQRYGFSHESEAVELVNLRITARAPVEAPDLTTRSGAATLAEARQGRREVTLADGEDATVPFYTWGKLPTDTRIDGPAILEGPSATAWIPPTFTAKMDGATLVATMEGGR